MNSDVATETRPAPSAETADLRPDAASDGPGGEAPGADGRDVGQVVREAREAAGRPETPDSYREAVAASEAEVGAVATRNRIAYGELTGADGQPLLSGLSREEREGLAQEYVADLRERAAAPDVALTETGEKLARQTAAVRDHLGTVYEDPDAALARLEGLDKQGRADFAAGRIDLGERRADAPDAELNTDGLLAHLDVRDRWPDEAGAVDAARDQDRTRELAREVDPENQPRRSLDELLEGVDPKRSLAEAGQDDFASKVTSQLAYQMSVPQQV